MAIRKTWSEAENAWLIANASRLTVQELADRYDVTRPTITSRLQKLGVKAMKAGWTEADEVFLIENYRTLGAEAVAERLGKTLHAVQIKACTLKATKPKTKAVKPKQAEKRIKRPWTDDDDDYIESHYTSMTAVSLSIKLDRSLIATKHRIRFLGLNKKRVKSVEVKNISAGIKPQSWFSPVVRVG